jgi:AraC-like DNA-binding protein
MPTHPTDNAMVTPAPRLHEAAALLERILDTTVNVEASVQAALRDESTVTAAQAYQPGDSVLAVRDGVRRIIVPTQPDGPAFVCEWPPGSTLSQSTLDVLRLVELLSGPGTAGPGDDAQPDTYRLDELEQPTDQTITTRHHTLVLEHTLEDMIRGGDQNALHAFLARRPIDLNLGQLSPRDALRGQKDVAICLITVATRSATDAGMTVESAFNLSDSYIRKLEACTTTDEVSALIESSFLDLAGRVSRHRRDDRPALVSRAESYIAHNLHGELSTDAIARHLGVRPHYLAQVFRSGHGRSVQQYVTESRVQAAKQLLAFSELSLLEISDRLGFYDQSHFTRTFKRLTATTPKRFRDTHLDAQRHREPRTEGNTA